eukprot:TRINITY_DN987_c0_g1_i4.p3 TRINITY_DN987_c0_g1~~TRINITY_DN987_c0_g1_i4.p3  ORF type:complete len:165 (-),score=20.26 TRINITY_DN987_c0_g1_i4:920-1414(-)
MLEDFPATVNRDVDDSSITHESKRRDFFVLLGGLLCIGGEDKNSTDKFEVALGECEAKHKGANAAMYGSLGYILLIIMAGTDFGVYAMPVEAGASTPERLVPRFSVRDVRDIECLTVVWMWWCPHGVSVCICCQSVDLAKLYDFCAPRPCSVPTSIAIICVYAS